MEQGVYPKLWMAEDPAPPNHVNSGKNKPNPAPEPVNEINYWFDSKGLKPEDFTPLIQDDRYSKHYAVTVAMLYGYIPIDAQCNKCNGNMQLGVSSNYVDELSWVCKGDGRRASKIGKSKVNKCKGRRSIRSGTWLESFSANLGRILPSIYIWFTGNLTLTVISEYTGLGYKTVQRI